MATASRGSFSKREGRISLDVRALVGNDRSTGAGPQSASDRSVKRIARRISRSDFSSDRRLVEGNVWPGLTFAAGSTAVPFDRHTRADWRYAGSRNLEAFERVQI